MESKSAVYLLENIIPHYYESTQRAEEYTLVLLKASERPNLKNSEDNRDFSTLVTTRERINGLHQGQFLYEGLGNANQDPVAKRHFRNNNLLRGRLLKKLSNIEEESSLSGNSKIYSYHINVGHGNCSIIVKDERGSKRIWMVDCSEYDYLNHKNYQNNIQSCLSYIRNKFSIQKLTIDKFFLTHIHYDHYSGISRLIDQGFINSRTIFFLNLHYSIPSENYNRLLRKIILLNCSIIEPLSTYSTNEIEIWHPRIRTVKTRSRSYLHHTVNVETNPNNSSSVLYFKMGGKSILFPGDIETEKWNTIHFCRPNLKHSNYFMLSHHGSLNGHLRDQCPVGRQITNLSDCLLNNAKPVVMGRNRAYNGIYSNQVINDFPQLIYSEHDNNNQLAKFLEIDWQTNQPTWEY